MARGGGSLAMLALVFVLPAARAADEATIRVAIDETVNRVTPYMTGACIEDVNHEIYGGIYSQMIFGESFQEPAKLPGFTAYGGSWSVNNGVLTAKAGAGPKLMADDVRLKEGQAGVELLLRDRATGNAGLVMMVQRPGQGADAFVGFEISLDAERNVLVLGRHDNSWQPIAEAPCQVPIGAWVELEMQIAGGEIEIFVDGESVLRYQDQEGHFAEGAVGLRTWQRDAQFRELWVRTDGELRTLPFDGPAHWSGGVSGMWRAVRQGAAQGLCAADVHRPFVGRQSQAMAFSEGTGAFGIENQGLHRMGMCFVAGQPYEGHVWARAEAATELFVALQSRDGAATYAEQRLQLPAGDWQRLDFELTPNAADDHGRLAITLRAPGSASIGYALLQAGEWGRFQGLPARRDVGQAMVEQGLTVLRLGGLMANAPEYRWKQMLGPRDRREPYTGFWYPHSSNGWGIIEFLDFCEAAGIQPVVDFNLDESPADMADFVEYVNGAADRPWGRRRSEDGHSASYQLKYIQLGNEEAVDDRYWQKFAPLAKAIWAQDAEVVLIVGDFEYREPIADPYDFDGAPKIRSLAAHQKILDLAKEHGRQVWFDVHIWNHDPVDVAPRIAALKTFASALGRISPGADFRLCVLEENAVNHAMRRALAHARTINGLMQMGDRVPMACAANALQVDGQNDNGWDQGLLFLNQCRTWGQPPYYVTQMMSRDHLPNRLKSEVAGALDELDVVALASDNRGSVKLSIVNANDRAVPVRIELEGAKLDGSAVRVTQLCGAIDDANTGDAPQRVVPRAVDESVERESGKPGVLRSTLPAYSVTTMAINRRLPE